MTWDWQLLVALVCVAAALFVLGRRGWRLWTGSARAGGGCASCPVHEGATASQAKPLVTLELGLPAAGTSPAGGDSRTGREHSPSNGTAAR